MKITHSADQLRRRSGSSTTSSASLSWPELARRTWRESIDDDVLGLAAQLAYYFFLALFPALLFLLALASFFSLSNFTDDTARFLGPFVSPSVLQLIQEQMQRLADNTPTPSNGRRPRRFWFLSDELC